MDIEPSIIEYRQFLDSIKSHIRQARYQTFRAANRELTQLYWQIGQEIVEKQHALGWGKGVVKQLAQDLKAEFGTTHGFSVQNLWYMRQFYLEYKEQPDLQQLVGEIPWGQNLLIMSKVKDPKERTYYLEATQKLAWTRDTLRLQIQSKAYERHLIEPKHNNFKQVLPIHLAEQADLAMKDVYALDMLGVTEPYLERDIERNMVARIQHVLLELGFGFTFIGSQYRVATEEKEYFIDLLLFNRKLRSLIAVEIKRGEFKAEYAGKMSLYLSLLDASVKEPDENPSIGLILCAERNKIEIEYTLQNIHKPIGVAEYYLTRQLPNALKEFLPAPKQIEEEILRTLSLEPSQDELFNENKEEK